MYHTNACNGIVYYSKAEVLDDIQKCMESYDKTLETELEKSKETITTLESQIRELRAQGVVKNMSVKEFKKWKKEN